jgi:hypothetical protein
MLALSLVMLGCASSTQPPAASAKLASAAKDDPAQCVTQASISATDEEPEDAEMHRRVAERLAQLGSCTRHLKQRGWLALELDAERDGSKPTVTLQSSTVEDCAAAECIRNGLTTVAPGPTDVREFVELVPGAPPRSATHLDAPTSEKAVAGKNCIDANSTATPEPRLPPKVIQSIVRSRYAELRRCYEAGLARDPVLTGRVGTRFVIGRNGSVIDANIETNTLPDCGVTACMLNVFRGLTFPKPRGGKVVVVYPVVFQPDKPAGNPDAPPSKPDPRQQAALDEESLCER